MIKGRFKQAYRIFKRIAKSNNKLGQSKELLENLKKIDKLEYFDDVGVEDENSTLNEENKQGKPEPTYV